MEKQRYCISEILDIKKISSIYELYYKLTDLVITLLDLNGETLLKVGSRTICTQFHHKVSTSNELFINDYSSILRDLSFSDKNYLHRYLNGLVEIFAPIIVDDECIGYLSVGQVFTTNPNLELFKNQAKLLGFDQDAYIDAVKELPIVSEQEIKLNVELLVNTTQGYCNSATTRLKYNVKELYKKVFEFAVDGIILGDSNGIITDVNCAFLELSGKSRNDIINKHISELFSEEQNRENPFRFDLLNKGEKVISQRYLINSDNRKVLIEMHSKLMPDKTYQTIVRDITMQQSVQNELLDNKTRLQLIYDASDDFIYSYDSKGRFTHANRSLINYLRLPLNQIIGKTYRELGFPDDVCSEWDELHNKVYETKTTVFGESSVLLKNGEKRYYEIVLNPLFDNYKTVVGISGVTRDITERKVAEKLLIESEASLKSLIDNRKDYIWSLDRNYKYLAFNKTYSELFFDQYDKELKSGMNALDFLEAEDKDFWITKCEASFKGQNIQFEYTYDIGNGMQYFQTSINPILEDNEVKGVSIISVDITESVRNKKRYEALFEYAPVPLWEEDLSETKKNIDSLKSKGVVDFDLYFEENPEVLNQLIASVKIIDVNQYALNLHQADSKEELLNGLNNIFNQESIVAFKKEMIAIAENKSNISFVSTVKTLKGVSKYIQLFWNVIPDYEKTLERVFISTPDISKMVESENYVKNINNKLVDILENMSDAFVALDRNWCYTYMNEKAAKMFNRNAKDMIGKHIWTEFPEGVGQPFHLNYEKAMNQRVFIKMEEYYPPYDKWFENRINPTSDGIAIFFTDVTVRKKNEEKIKQFSEELELLVEERTRELEMANKDLEEINDLFVGREMRIIELKEEISRLKRILSMKNISFDDE